MGSACFRGFCQGSTAHVGGSLPSGLRTASARAHKLTPVRRQLDLLGYDGAIL